VTTNAIDEPVRPAILGHRGASAYAGDNTIEAFRLAVAQGASGIECDVRFTADEVIVMSHDPVIPGLGALADVTFEELRQSRPGVPTLDETIGALPEEAFLLNIEIKNTPGEPGYDPTDQMAVAVVDVIHREQLGSRVLVSSFNRATIDAVRAADTSIPTGYLIGATGGLGSSLSGLSADGHEWVLPHYSSLLTGSDRPIDRAHEAGLLVGTWTVDNPGQIAALAAGGIDAIITNDPALALQALD
jgi:glycerophosphoryl diester phosphodiesterase